MKDAGDRMSKSVAALQTELTKIRTGRAHTSLLDHITVEYYGSPVPLNQVSNVGVEDSRTLTITPWEKDMVGPIEKAKAARARVAVFPECALSGFDRAYCLSLAQQDRKRGMDAIEIVKHFIDDATVVGVSELRILHGKGNGILKQMVREYLGSTDIVNSFGDEHEDHGGSGVTVVRLDF